MISELFEIIGNLIICMMDIATFYLFMHSFFTPRVKKVWLGVWFVVALFIMYFVNKSFNNSGLNCIMTCGLILGFCLIYETTVSQKIFTYVSLFSIILFSELMGLGFAFSNGAVEYSQNMDYLINKSVYLIYFAFAFLSKATAIVVVLIFSVWMKRKHIFTDSNRLSSNEIYLAGASFISFAVIAIVEREFFSGTISVVTCFFVYSAMLAIIILFYMAYYHMIQADNAILEKKLLEEDYAHRKLYYSEMERHQNEIRGIRHDLKNRLLAILADANDVQNIKRQLDSLMNEIKNTEIISYSENIQINMILNEKIKSAAVYGIKSDLDIKVPYQINIDYGDLGVLVGNLLDNAIEAAAKCSEDKRQISFGAYYYKNSLVITCSNCVAGSVVSMETSKKDKINHGFGMKSISGIVQKYNGRIENSSDNNIFKTEINLWIPSET